MVFLDTGIFLARFLKRDQHHSRSLKLWDKLVEMECLSSNHVIDETLTILGRRASYEFAAAQGREIYGSHKLKILRTSEEDELRALDVFEKYADQGVSFTDSTSFVLMQSHQIQTVCSFDRHFELAGFEMMK